MTAGANALLEIARRAVAIGGELLAKAEPGQITQKGDRDFVTDLDLRVQAAVRQYLAETTPEIDFLGEELAELQPSLATNNAMWVLDPIDGTSNFIHGIPLSAVSLALVEHGHPSIGVILAPFLGLEYYAAADGGAFSNGEPISSSRARALTESIVSLGDYAVGVGANTKNQRRIVLTSALAAAVERVRMFGSAALDLAWVADGRTDACVILSNKPWDTAAGVLIAREAGALVTDSAGHDHSLMSTDTVAATPAIARQLLELIRNTA
ncbi:inositol monophosphatase family protein [Nocardia lijiangensis]|uniref:inositol monophosphatase family protein n=1 Tax=Nocardia lijiangensis TaxID=299618 RepID=UPI00082A7B21|nr:inositol monophosphatase family protein [Nocardia lijiangensis]